MRQRFGTPETARAWLPSIVLAALWTLSFLAWKATPFDGIDYVRYYEPYQQFLRESLRRGEIPWWNPYSSLGRPFLADLPAAATYPATLLVLLLGAKVGWVVGTFIHGLIAAEGFGRLARKLGASAGIAASGAAVFLFSGPVFGRMELGGVNYVYSLCFLPWVLWTAAGIADAPSRRLWVTLAATLALELWGGHPQVFWLSAVGAGLFTTGFLAFPPWTLALKAWLRTELSLLAACLAAMALMGFILVPFMELVGQSNRAQPSLAFSGAFSMNGLQWMSLVWPSWNAYGVFAEYNLFAGVAVAIGGLAAIGGWRDPAVRGAAFLGAGGAIIAAGPSTALFNVLYAALPGLSSFRVPARAGVLVTLALILGAAILAGKDRAGGKGRLAPPGLAAAALLGAVLYAVHPRAQPFPAMWLAMQASLACLGGLGWWLWIGREGGRGPASWVRGAILPAALLAELCVSVQGIKRSNPFDSRFPGEPTVLEAIHSIGADGRAAPARVCVDSVMFRENAGMIYRVSSVVGYETLSLGRVWNYLHRAAGADPSQPFSTVPDGRIFNAAPRLRAFNLSASLALGASRLTVEREPDPRAYLAQRMEIVSDSRAAIRAMVSGADFHGTALVEAPDSGAFVPDPEKPAGTATIRRFTLNAVDIEVTSPGRAILVLAEAWYPGWRAEIDGRPVPCAPVNAWMRGVPVPAGTSAVRLHFHQDGLLAGCIVSAASALVLVLMWRGARRDSGPAMQMD